MTELENRIIQCAEELLETGAAARVVGLRKSEFAIDVSPAVFCDKEELKEFVYNDFCGANLSKYLIQVSKAEGKTAVFLKPCDTYSFNQLVKEHRIDREKIIVVGVECHGKIDNYKLAANKIDGITSEKTVKDDFVFETLFGQKTVKRNDVLLDRCLTCKSKKFAVCDKEIVVTPMTETNADRFLQVKEIEAMSPEQRFAFFRKELSKCIRCNACRNVCPACTCVKCVFDNVDSGISAKANDDAFEEKLFHIIRAFHVSGRCTDCGECSRVCPQRIPLHLFNRKFILDIDRFYGEYQAGESSEGKTPLTEYTQADIEPNDAVHGEKK